MSEQLKHIEPQENEIQEWQLLSEMPQRDYWVGAAYTDMYRGRLELNVPRFEHICRQLNLPPIEITSVPYNPPAEEYPEMVGHGLAAWKKAVFGRPRSSNDPSSIYDVMSMPEVAILGIQFSEQQAMIPVPLGWRLGIRARKIERDIARFEQDLTLQEQEKLFVDRFNEGLWQGIKKIQSHEWSDTRTLGMQSSTSKNNMIHLVSAFSGGLTPSVIEMVSGADLSAAQWVGSIIGGVSGMQVLSSEILQAILERNADTTVDARLREKVSMAFSNSWRKEFFPERFEKEIHGMRKWTELAIHGVPYVGLTMEKDVKYAVVKKQQDAPLVRLAG